MEPEKHAAKQEMDKDTKGDAFFNEIRKHLKMPETLAIQEEANGDSYLSWWKDFGFDEADEEEKAKIEHYLMTGEWEDEDEDA